VKTIGDKMEKPQDELLRDKAGKVKEKVDSLKTEIAKAIVGQRDVVEGVLICLLCGGHALLEGVPGLGKTYLIKSLGNVLNLATSRIQFTPDLMPADIIGTNVLVQNEESKRLIQFQKGPIFSHIVLADEINRATPKTQSALLEAMQEQQITVSGVQYRLESPFVVLATQNPIEMEGTYPLPEAQLDRFFFKLTVGYPQAPELEEIINRTTTGNLPVLTKVADAETIEEMKSLVRKIPIASPVKDYVIRLVLSTHPQSPFSTALSRRYVKYGSSPRGTQSLVLAGKVMALLDGRFNVSFDDIRRVIKPSLRHRIILNFEGEAGGITAEDIIDDLIRETAEVADSVLLNAQDKSLPGKEA
jgi:MoxR-like ATPase